MFYLLPVGIELREEALVPWCPEEKVDEHRALNFGSRIENTRTEVLTAITPRLLSCGM
jgi:hypothetical protein